MFVLATRMFILAPKTQIFHRAQKLHYVRTHCNNSRLLSLLFCEFGRLLNLLHMTTNMYTYYTDTRNLVNTYIVGWAGRYVHIASVCPVIIVMRTSIYVCSMMYIGLQF